MKIYMGFLVIAMILCFALICLLGTKDENERKIDDEEQLKWIEEWNNKKGLR